MVVTPSRFQYTIVGDVLRVKLVRSGGQILPFELWGRERPDAASVIGLLAAAIDEDRRNGSGRQLVSSEFDEVELQPEFVAALSVSDSAALGLPATTVLAVDLRTSGLITDVDFVVQSRWVRPGGTPALVRVSGALIEQGREVRRIPEPLFSVWNAAQALGRPLPERERYAALAALKETLPNDARSAISLNGYLDSLRLHFASAFSLRLGRDSPFDFDPVLFGKGSSRANENGELLDEEDDSLLPPAAQKIFAEDVFRRYPAARPAYALKTGDYVYVDPQLRPALDIVRRLQDAPEEERKAFVTNPRRLLHEKLTRDNGGEFDVDQLFVETEQFSQRVKGVDEWREPVLPWIKPKPNTWLPEAFGVRAGDEYIELAPELIEPLIEAVDRAIEKERPTATYGSITIPATPQAKEALAALRPLSHKSDERREFDDVGGKPPMLSKRMFLIVRDNLSEVEYAPFQDVRPEGGPPAVIPRILRTALKPHQREGFQWLVRAFRNGCHGALLADDMGLGKTLQAIAFISWLQETWEVSKPRRPALIVAPTGLLANWQKEINVHLSGPGLGSLVLAFGTNLRALRDEDTFSAKEIDLGRSCLKTDAWRTAGVVLTTYETMRDYHFSFAKTPFITIVFDEIQKLKNPASQLTRAAKTLNTDFVIGMTGTPVENRLQDIWSIMDILIPGVLGPSRTFDDRYPSHDQAALGKLKALLMDEVESRPPHVLRRLKSDHLPGLPRKSVHSKEIEMPPRQASAYQAVVARAVAGRSSFDVKDGMLKTLHALRGVSLHPTDPAVASGDLESYVSDSARLKWTIEILSEIARKREKVLIFLESLSMQDRLSGLLRQKFQLPHLPPRIHGGVPGFKRQEIVDRFQQRSGFDVMILSPKAGGVGLNLTAANHVIHLSRWWNPAVEDQSTDRVYRIGQTKEVHVYLPLAVHPEPTIKPSSFDLRLNDLIRRKRELSQHMLAPADAFDSDIATLFDEVAGGTVAKENVDDLITRLPPGMFPTKRWSVPSKTERPLDEILRPFERQKITHLLIRDPYALGPNNRTSQAQFITELRRRGATIDALTIEYKYQVPVGPAAPETENQQQRDMEQHLIRAFEGALPRLVFQAHPRRGKDFHDRWIEIDCASARGTERHSLYIGRGLPALMDSYLELNAFYVPPAG